MPDHEIDKKREATASIRGYFYQLDATLLELLNAADDDEIVIEGIEDFDRYSEDQILYSQVKYYAGQDLTDSVLREPLHKLFTHFSGLTEEQRSNRKYRIYGHFLNVNISLAGLTAQRFRKIMEYTKRPKSDDGTTTITKHSMLDGHVVSDSVIDKFCDQFELKISENFDVHRSSVIKAVGSANGESLFEAEELSYPRAINFISNLAVASDHTKRRSSRRLLLIHLKGCQAIHHKWLLREKETKEYGMYFRKLYFQKQNIHGADRFFIIEIGFSGISTDAVDLLAEISRKWSSVNSRKLPDCDRHAPFVILRGITSSQLVEIKNGLYDLGIEFVDGYPYSGSPYRARQIHTAQNNSRKISLRLIDTDAHLDAAINHVSGRPCYIYDFFMTRPSKHDYISSNRRTYSIPFENFSHIKNII